MATERLVIENLSIESERGGKWLPLLRGVSLDLERGGVFGLIGESGSGKTMTCRAVAGALPHGVAITAGEVRVGPSVLRSAKGRTERRKPLRVAMIFADAHASLDPLQRVGDQVAEMLRVHQGLRGRAAKREVVRLFEEVRLSDPDRVYQQYPFQLSGGMAQRAMIASVLAAKPQFLLADEPTSALDSTLQFEILDLLSRLVAVEGLGILVTTHDMSVVAHVCDRVAVMYAGKVVETAATDNVLKDPQHPYTRLLLQARPRGTRSERLTAIPGEPPIPGELRGCCSFSPRCPWAQDRCREEEPALVLRDQVAVACHFAGRLRELPS